MSAADHFGTVRSLVNGLPPENAVAVLAGAGDITAAGICRMLGFYEDALHSRGWDAPPTLWVIERLDAAPGRAGLAGCGGWQLPRPGTGEELAATLRELAGFVGGPGFPPFTGPGDLAAWALGTEVWSTREGAALRVLYAADRAGLRYQVRRLRGNSPVMYVVDGAGGALAGPVQDAVAELALAGGPAPGDVT